LKVLQVSSLHLYLTYPFVLSWSLLEALACECLVLASDTAPVQEVIKEGHNGYLTGFFDEAAWIRRCCDLLDARQDLQEVRRNARTTVLERYDLRSVCLPQQMDFLQKLTL
jgi:glycosyltransferase involved in cell wall biosynthesis